MKEEKKKESGWPIEDDELDNVSGGMRPVIEGEKECPFCSLYNRGQTIVISYDPYTIQCPYCGCKYTWDAITCKNTIVAPGST